MESPTNELLTTNDLSDAGCFALCYAQACIADGKRAKNVPLTDKERLELMGFHRAVEQLDRAGVKERARHRVLVKGLAELMELGILECERDGMGAWVPKVLHEERITLPAARLVTRDMQ